MTSKFLYKQAIVVREDLEMSPGKLAVQVAHASIGAIYKPKGYLPKVVLENWFDEGFRKIVLKSTKENILSLEEKCIKLRIPSYVVYDFGLTELEPNTLTCIGIGPDLNENINKVTGNLRLYR